MASIEGIVDSILSTPGPIRLVAVDGRGGAGKTTFAEALAREAGDVPLVHTDDFATRASRWWPLLLEEVIEPIKAGDARTFSALAAAGASHPDGPPMVIIEGVSAGRREWAEHLSFVIWIDTPTNERRRRWVKRDGVAALDEWDSYEDEEDRFFANDPVRDRADLVTNGTEISPVD